MRPSLAYKPHEDFPFTLFEGTDFLEPFLPLAATRNGDVGRIVLDTALPYGLLATAFAARGTDQHTLRQIQRWGWAGIDDSKDNYPFLFGMVALSGLSLFLPAPEDGDRYSIRLRIDRFAVFGLGVGLSNLEVEILKKVFNRPRPDEPFSKGGASRPSGHAVTGFASAAFLSSVLRDTLRPEDEPNLGLRVLEEVGSALPYLGAFYLSLERVHHYKHFLSDTFLSGAIGIFTTKLFWDWAFLRSELGESWAGSFDVGYERGGFHVAWVVPF